jgi:hypothetical protein
LYEKESYQKAHDIESDFDFHSLRSGRIRTRNSVLQSGQESLSTSWVIRSLRLANTPSVVYRDFLTAK